MTIELDDLDTEDLRCAGLRRASDDEWRLPLDAGDLAQAFPPSAAPKRRERKPTLASQLGAVWKAARAAGVQVAVTVEAGKVTAIPVNGAAVADSDVNEWDRDLGTHPAEVRQ